MQYCRKFSEPSCIQMGVRMLIFFQPSESVSCCARTVVSALIVIWVFHNARNVTLAVSASHFSEVISKLNSDGMPANSFSVQLNIVKHGQLQLQVPAGCRNKWSQLQSRNKCSRNEWFQHQSRNKWSRNIWPWNSGLRPFVLGTFFPRRVHVGRGGAQGDRTLCLFTSRVRPLHRHG